MIKITLYSPSQALFDHVERLLSHVQEPIDLSWVKGDYALCLDGGDLQKLSVPIRIGSIIDSLLSISSKDKGRWRQAEEVNLGEYTLFPREMAVLDAHDQRITLTEKERDMLICLYQSNDHAISKGGLLDQVWGYGQGVETHTLETHIYRLRQKIEKDPSAPLFLVTTDDGYKLNVS